MTATTHPMTSPHHFVLTLVSAAVAVGLTIALMLAFTAREGGNARHPGVEASRTASATLCMEFANASPGSPAALRLADAITAQGGC